MIKIFRRLCPLALAASLLVTAAGADSYVMTYSFAGTPAIYKKHLDETGGTVNTISPSSFDLNADGSVTLHSLDSAAIQQLHAEGVKVTPFLSNHWDKASGNAALDNIEAVTNTLRDAVGRYELDGINVDIQNVNEQYRDKYTQFVKRLGEKLPGKIITVAVAANPYGWTQGWHGSYDYAALAKLSDYLMIMAYDESYYGSAAGPVASSGFVEKSIQYALRHTTPDKLVLGVPLFGRYWKSGDSAGGYGISMRDVDTLLSAYPEARKTYDETSHSVCVEVTLSSPVKLWGGKTLSAGSYTIWYDDLQALEYKLELINRYKLHGVGSWSLGQESAGFWELCARVLQNRVFSDTNGHWAESSILSCYEKGWLLGQNGMFRPEDTLTRAEAATIFVRVLQLENAAAGEDFADTSGHWAKKNIAIARLHGIMQGVGGNMFRPDENITRQEMAVLLDRVMVLSTGIDFNDNPFSDLSEAENPWSYQSMIKLYGNGVFHGYPDGTIRPLNGLSRGEMASLLERVSGYGFTPQNSPLRISGQSADPSGNNERPVQPR